MRKPIALCLCICLLVCLCACSSLPAVAEGQMRILVQMDVDSPAYGIHYEYALSGQAMGGGDIVYASGDALKKGEKLVITLSKENFPDNADLSKLQIDLSVIGPNQEETPATPQIAFAGEYKREYQINITGSEEQGFVCALQE